MTTTAAQMQSVVEKVEADLVAMLRDMGPVEAFTIGKAISNMTTADLIASITHGDKFEQLLRSCACVALIRAVMRLCDEKEAG